MTTTTTHKPHGYCLAPISLIGGYMTNKEWERIFDVLKDGAAADLTTARKLNPRVDKLVKLLERDKMPYDWEAENVVMHEDEHNPPSLVSFSIRVIWEQDKPMKVRKPTLPKPSNTPFTIEHIRKQIAAVDTFQWAWAHDRSGDDMELARLRAEEKEWWFELERLSETRERYAPGADCTDDSMELVAA